METALSGHSRVPLPPHRITGWIALTPRVPFVCHGSLSDLPEQGQWRGLICPDAEASEPPLPPAAPRDSRLRHPDEKGRPVAGPPPFHLAGCLCDQKRTRTPKRTPHSEPLIWVASTGAVKVVPVRFSNRYCAQFCVLVAMLAALPGVVRQRTFTTGAV